LTVSYFVFLTLIITPYNRYDTTAGTALYTEGRKTDYVFMLQ
jgi:hypothetical protein